jgi:diphthamide biosynthesis protein 2
VINSLNEAKLNNFAEIEVYILISCSVNSIIDPKMYYKNILSPYELLLCLDEIEWNSSI